MKKLFQTGLALGNISGNCLACNIDMSWLYNTPSKLLWIDKIVMTEHLWNLLVSSKKSEYKAMQNSNSFQIDLMNKTEKLVFEILDSVGLIERINDKFVSEDNYEIIYKQIDYDFTLLQKMDLIKTTDSHIYSIGDCKFCVPKLWTLYFALLASKRLNANIFSKKGIRNSQSNMQTFSISPQDRIKILSLQIRRDGTCVKKYFSLLAQSYT